jgi:hypothetical protein
MVAFGFLYSSVVFQEGSSLQMRAGQMWLAVPDANNPSRRSAQLLRWEAVMLNNEYFKKGLAAQLHFRGLNLSPAEPLQVARVVVRRWRCTTCSINYIFKLSSTYRPIFGGLLGRGV